ncbi:MAG TPA: carboxypeptidase regulatory-like domain-containing protein, partial [Thermoanaerobaculia bacterium]|nr:carboxypeptidase regulatory-like domain-containing protein [Thermoanaerobaculia bacterium]
MRRSWLALFLVLSFGLAFPLLGQEITVGGQMLDSKGKPAAGVGVELIEVPAPFAAQQLQLQGKPLPDPTATVKSDAQGRFRLAVPRPGMWTVVVRERGSLPVQANLTPLLESTELPPLTLGRDTPLRLRVLDRQGRPVAGARVLSFGFSGRFSLFQGWLPLTQLAVTAEDGTVTVPRSSQSTLMLRAVSPAHPEARLEVEPSRSSADLRLAAGCERTVEVQDAKRQPVAGALVQTGEWAVGTTDAAGRLVVAAPCDRELAVTAETTDGRLARGSLKPAPKGAAPAPARLTLPAQAARLSGRVLDTKTRRPIAAALVWPEDAAASFVRTDAAGSYTVAAPRRKEGELQAAALLYNLAQAQPGPSSPDGGVQPGPTLALQPQATLSGVVVDKAGRPVAGAALQAETTAAFDFNPRGFRSRQPVHALSDAAGKFQMRLSADQDYTLTARHDDFSPAQRPLASLRPRETKSDLRIVLERGLSAFGQVVDVERRPIAGAQVSLVPAEGPDFMNPASFMEPREPARPVATDAQGRFRMEHLTAGQWSLQVAARGFGPLTVPGLDIQEGGQEGGAKDLGTVILHPGVVLEGRVVDPQNRPVEGVEVRHSSGGIRGRFLMLRDEEYTPIFSAADGLFAVPDLRAGDKLFISFRKQGYTTTDLQELEVPQAELLRVVLKPGSRVAGRVVDEAGDPVAGARVSLQSAGTQLVLGGGRFPARMIGTGLSEEDGSFSILGVEAGKVTLNASATGFLAKEMTALEVPAGRDLEGLEVVLGRGAMVVGRVLGPSGSPVADAQVEVVPPAERGFQARADAARAATDGDGNYRLEGVAEGPVLIAATHHDYQRAVKDLEVKEGENRADLRLEEGAEVSGRVVDSSGQPVEGAQVVVNAPSSRGAMIVLTSGMGGPPQARTGADGTFRIANVADGTYEVQADKTGYAPARLRDVQVDGSVRGLELRLESGGAIRGRITGLELPDLGEVNVMARHLSERTMRSGQVDYKGDYRIEGLAEGDWEVSAFTGSNRSAQAKGTVTAGSETVVDLEFGGGLVLSGRVVRGSEPVSGASIFANGSDVEAAGGGRT